METTIRRFAVLMMVGFWQGGFLFYTSVVVPLGQKVLGSDLQQGFLTQQVTDSLNWAGVATLPFLAWDLVRGDKRSWVGRGRWGCWMGLAATLAEGAGVIVTPGETFGAGGAGFVRVAAVQPDDRIELAARRVGL